MKATVVTTFKDSESKKVFRVGDEFPLENVKQERIDLLTKPHPKTNKIYLFVEGEQEQQQQQQDDKGEGQQQEQKEPSTGDAQKVETLEEPPPPAEETKQKASTRRKTKQEPSTEGE